MKKNSNLIKWLIVIVGLILILFLFYRTKEKREYKKFSTEYVLTEEVPYMMQFVYYSGDEWKEKMEENSFPSRMTYGELEWLVNETGTSAYVTYQKGNEKEIVSRTVWNEVYGQLLDLLDTNGRIKRLNVPVLSIEDDNVLVTGEGKLKNHLPKDFVQEQKAYNFYIMDQEIVGIYGNPDGEALVKNVLVTDISQQKVSFLYENSAYSLSITVDENQVIHQVCDIVWANGELSAVRLKKDTIEGNLVSLNETTIEIDGYGEMKRDLRLPVYKTYGSVEEKELSDIVIANMKVKYVVAEGSVEAILLVEPAELKNIRVLLLGEGGGIYRSDVRITSDMPFTLSYGETNAPQAEHTIVALQDFYSQGVEGVIKINPAEGSTWYFCNEKGEKTSFNYYGTFEVRNYPEGMAVVNEVPIENYLCSVVPSEMPISYELEALKAQAVCARSYAYIQLLSGDYAAYGAHIDDSTKYQVYNKHEQDEKTSRAVMDTAGLVITYQGNVAEAYYFSTSSGVTSNGDCWGLDTNPAYGYLKSFSLDESAPMPDLSTEEAFSQFITNGERKGYDSAMPYYRWKTVCRFDTPEILDKIKSILSERKSRVPDNISYLTADLLTETDSMEGFGNLTDIGVESRSLSGIITQLLLRYENGCVRVRNEYNIRLIFGSSSEEIILSDGSSKKEAALLPSAIFCYQKAEDGSYQVSGGGYGHSIGMSQNGAQGMAQSGKTFDQILQSFFSNIEITTVSW